MPGDIPSEDDILAQAKAIYAHIGGGASDKCVATGSVNEIVMKSVTDAARIPLLDIMKIVSSGIESSRDIATSIGSLRGQLQTEVDTLPTALGADTLSDLAAPVRNVMDIIKSVAVDPRLLYPRVLCGSIPVDPAKVGGILQQFKVFEAVDVVARANSGPDGGRSMRGSPQSTSEVVAVIAAKYFQIGEVPLLFNTF
jgi:hypothetical protein